MPRHRVAILLIVFLVLKNSLMFKLFKGEEYNDCLSDKKNDAKNDIT